MMISNIDGTQQQFPDGPYMVHYIVMDTAGNATHYQKDIYIENNKPRITYINIGTDINFSGFLDYPSEFKDKTPNGKGYEVNNTSEGRGNIDTPDKEFRIRNERFGMRLELEKGNGAKWATVTYVTKDVTAIPVTAMKRGRVYQIATTAPDTDFTKYGAPNGYKDTIFIAASNGEGKGEVYQFIEVKKQGPDAVIPANIIGFNDFTGITDTTTGLFIVKVYDTVLSGDTVHPEYDQLSHAVLLTVSINNDDNISPKIDVTNFGQRHKVPTTAVGDLGNPANYDANLPSALADAVYTDYVDATVTTATTTKNGYVQYQAHSAANDGAADKGGTANISGKVIFNGKVNDNHQINRIAVTIPGYNGGNGSGIEFDIATRNSSGLLEQTSNVAGERVFRLVWTEAQVPQNTLEYGHTLVWQFMWDSSKIDTVADDNVDITFKVYDGKNATSTSVKNVNINPYISEVVTSLSNTYYVPSVFNRSALGGYPVREGETITIKGFNLGKTDLGNTTLTIGGTSLTPSLANPPGIAGGIKGTVTGVNSGDLVVTVNGKNSFNNSDLKNKTTDYNKEPNGVNNNKLDNSRYIYVWNTGWLYNQDIPYISNPFMRVNSSGNRLLSFGFYNGQSTGRLKVRKDNTNYILGTAYSNRVVFSTVAASKTLSTFYAAASDLSSQNNRGFQLGKSNAGGTGNSANSTPADDNSGNATATGSLNLYAMTSSNPERFRIPRIAVQSTGSTRTNDTVDRILMSYFDNESNNKEVRIIYGAVGAADGFNISTSATPTTSGATSVIVADNTQTYKGSMYTAVGFLSDGKPLIAWYDNTSQNLMFSFVNSTPGGNTSTNGFLGTAAIPTATWQNNAAVIAEGKGTHVDMAVDKNDNVHLAYYSDEGGLWYTYIPAADVTNKAREPNSVRVDTFLSAGTKIMINVRNDTTIPYISYAHASFPGTRHSIRVAWLVNTSEATAAGTNDDDTFTGLWEVMTVPVRSDVIPNIDEFICNGVMPTNSSGAWTAPGGASTLTYNSMLHQSILVGFFTNLTYEGAILKGNILTVPLILQK
ncbi:hypothetical protein R84B8_01124 [Treponema sp. R8-4-B8]